MSDRTQSFCESGLIEADDLHELIKNTPNKVKILDGTYVLPGSSKDPKEEFQKAHIEGAQFFDIDKIADQSSDLPHMLPDEAEFNAAVMDLGINQGDFIVVYGQEGLVMGPARVWWTFRAFGHENICILNGGLPAWLKKDYPVTNVESLVMPSEFKGHKDYSLISTMKDVKNAQDSALIFDARPPARFKGEQPEPRAELISGHIPGSYNIPAGSLIDDDGKLKPYNELKEIFSPYNLSPNTSIITTCGSGVTACVIALALYNIGINNASIYDGSWAEWGKPNLNNSIHK